MYASDKFMARIFSFRHWTRLEFVQPEEFLPAKGTQKNTTLNKGAKGTDVGQNPLLHDIKSTMQSSVCIEEPFIIFICITSRNSILVYTYSSRKSSGLLLVISVTNSPSINPLCSSERQTDSITSNVLLDDWSQAYFS